MKHTYIVCLIFLLIHIGRELLSVVDLTVHTEWDHGSCSDVLHVPCLDIQNSLQPILIKVQSIVNEDFMERLVKYSQSAKQLYKCYPLVMVSCIDKLFVSLLFITSSYLSMINHGMC
ncbi:hypothetical protein CLU79DRAFT_758547 [Phycomyces nitens]|nr:hypothetical protein CLU79DRAFT_758547 [Phycomyces nitens]